MQKSLKSIPVLTCLNRLQLALTGASSPAQHPKCSSVLGKCSLDVPYPKGGQRCDRTSEIGKSEIQDWSTHVSVLARAPAQTLACARLQVLASPLECVRHADTNAGSVMVYLQ